MNTTIHHGNNLDILPTIPDNTFDAIITDPPYELGFMGKKWDASGIAYNTTLWAECLRVLKPGGHLLAFGGTRTYHRMACAIEDAGFEIRDSIHWIYGSGFPKSLDVSKAIDKAAGATREVIGEKKLGGNAAQSTKEKGGTYASNTNSVGVAAISVPITAPSTKEAKQWEGWGTALKPAHEPIVLARKPLIGTVINNVLTHRTGALNIDACRVGFQSDGDRQSATPQGRVTSNIRAGAAPDIDNEGRVEINRPDNSQGRWPANVILDPDAAEELGPEARYFYCAKPSKKERNAGLDHLEERPAGIKNSSGRGFSETDPHREIKARNFHPTVKPLALMRYLIRLVTPPNGHILDPFAGSGTTLTAAILEGHDSTGIELTDDYIPIIKARTKWAAEQPPTLLQ